MLTSHKKPSLIIEGDRIRVKWLEIQINLKVQEANQLKGIKYIRIVSYMLIPYSDGVHQELWEGG